MLGRNGFRSQLSIGRSARASLAVLLGTIVGIAALEAFCRLVLPPPGFEPFPEHHLQGLLSTHATRGYSYSPGFEGAIKTSDLPIRIEINELGMRDGPLMVEGSASLFLAVGDSFTVGFGVAASEAWPSRLEAAMRETAGTANGIRVVNAGVSGYSLRQIRTTVDELLALEPQVVLVGLYASAYSRIDDPYVLWNGYLIPESQRPSARIVENGFVLSSGMPRFQNVESWLDEHFLFGSYVFRSLPGRLRGLSSSPSHAETLLQPLLDELEALSELTSRRGIRLVTMAVNHQELDGRFSQVHLNDIVGRACLRLRVPFLDLIPFFDASSEGKLKYRLKGDHHWSAEAHEVAALELYRFLRDQGILRRSRLVPAEESLSPQHVSPGRAGGLQQHVAASAGRERRR